MQAEADAWNSKADQMREDRATRELSENRAQDAQRRAAFDRCIETGADTIAGCAHCIETGADTIAGCAHRAEAR